MNVLWILAHTCQWNTIAHLRGNWIRTFNQCISFHSSTIMRWARIHISSTWWRRPQSFRDSASSLFHRGLRRLKLPLPIYYPTALLFHKRRLLNGCSSHRGPTAVQKRKFSRRPIGHWTNPCGSSEVQEMPNKHQGVRSQPAVPPAAVEWNIYFLLDSLELHSSFYTTAFCNLSCTVAGREFTLGTIRLYYFYSKATQKGEFISRVEASLRFQSNLPALNGFALQGPKKIKCFSRNMRLSRLLLTGIH